MSTLFTQLTRCAWRYPCGTQLIIFLFYARLPVQNRPRNPSVAAVTNANVSSSLRSFRVVGRILTHHELRRSRLRHPMAATDDDPDCERTQRLADCEEPFSTVIAVCHDSHAGNVEYISEGRSAGSVRECVSRHPSPTTPFTFEREPT